MQENILNRAGEAIFCLQLNTPEAIRYVVKHAHVDSKTAGQAIKQVLVGYKK